MLVGIHTDKKGPVEPKKSTSEAQKSDYQKDNKQLLGALLLQTGSFSQAGRLL
jgi:hypothetical protein